MATLDLKRLFGNNERRERSAVTATVPFVIAPADIREGVAEEVLVSGNTYTVATIPSGVVITALYLVVDDAFDSATSAAFAVSLDGVAKIAAGNGAAIGIVETDVAFPNTLVTGGSVDITVVPTLTGATTKGSIKVVAEYLDYRRSTKSFVS